MEEVSKAIELILCFDSIIGRAEADAVARRLDDLPALTVTTGLVPALTFYLSKVRDKGNKQLNALRVLLPALIEDRCSEIEDDITESLSGEGGGYGAALALVAAAMIKLEIMSGEIDREHPEKYLARELAKLSRDPVKLREAEARVLPMIVEFKKLADAFYKKEKKG